MGVNIVDQVDRIFARKTNFDESGFANADLVTVELANRLGNLSSEERRELIRRGYELHWFGDGRSGDGMIAKEVRGDKDKTRFFLKLYYNQTFPRENAEQKAKESQKDGFQTEEE